MCLGRELSSKTRTELETLKIELNLTDDELQVFNCLSRGKSNIQTAMICNCSLATVGNRVADIKAKMNRVGEVYINNAE